MVSFTLYGLTVTFGGHLLNTDIKFISAIKLFNIISSSIFGIGFSCGLVVRFAIVLFLCFLFPLFFYTRFIIYFFVGVLFIVCWILLGFRNEEIHFYLELVKIIFFLVMQATNSVYALTNIYIFLILVIFLFLFHLVERS